MVAAIVICNRTGVMHIERPFSHSVGIIAALCGTATKIERFQGRSKMLGSRKVVRNVFRAPDKRDEKQPTVMLCIRKGFFLFRYQKVQSISSLLCSSKPMTLLERLSFVLDEVEY